MSADELIPFVAILAAAVTALSTLAGIRIANSSAERQLAQRLQHQDEKDQKEALRSRLEELYQLIDQWAGAMVSNYVNYRSVMDGRLTYNQTLDITISSKIEVNAARMFTLAELYFPKCHENLETIKSCRENLGRIEGTYREMYREHGPIEGTNSSKELTSELGRFNDAVDLYKKALAEHAREV